MNEEFQAPTGAAEVGTFGRVESVAVERIGRRLLDVGFGADGSLLTPGTPVWSTDNLQSLTEDYVEKPELGAGKFFEKLRVQLGESSPAAIQLFAELFILQALPIINLGGTLKVKQIEDVLNMSPDPVALPADVRSALLAGGVFHGGQAFTTYRWAQISYLIQVARHFKNLPEVRRAEALADPLLFRVEVDAVPTGQSAQRQSLLYLAFPQFFLPIVNTIHRAAIRDAFANEYLPDPSGDVDVDLAQIYKAITDSEGSHVDLYVEPWLSRWQRAKIAEPTDKVRHAWKVSGANVKGFDMVPIWRQKQSVSLAASLLRPVDADVTREELKAYVDEDYRTSGYAARQEKFDEFYAFITRIHAEDLVVTVSGENVFFGTAEGPAEFTASSDGRSNLRRSVKWFEQPCSLSEVPTDIAARLCAQGEVLDMSQHLDVLVALAERRPTPTGGFEVQIRDANHELAKRIHVGVDWLQDCVELLRERRQLIFYGPPGTGKTYIAQELARHVTDKANVKVVQFHPAYSYEDFFEGFRRSNCQYLWIGVFQATSVSVC